MKGRINGLFSVHALGRELEKKLLGEQTRLSPPTYSFLESNWFVRQRLYPEWKKTFVFVLANEQAMSSVSLSMSEYLNYTAKDIT